MLARWTLGSTVFARSPERRLLQPEACEKGPCRPRGRLAPVRFGAPYACAITDGTRFFASLRESSIHMPSRGRPGPPIVGWGWSAQAKVTLGPVRVLKITVDFTRFPIISNYPRFAPHTEQSQRVNCRLAVVLCIRMDSAYRKRNMWCGRPCRSRRSRPRVLQRTRDARNHNNGRQHVTSGLAGRRRTERWRWVLVGIPTTIAASSRSCRQ